MCGPKENNRASVPKPVAIILCVGTHTKKIFSFEEMPALYNIQKCLRIIFYLICTSIYAEMAASRFSSNVLQKFYSPITREQNRNLPQPLRHELVPLRDGFKISQSNFQEWLRVWIMDVSKTNPNNKDILMFARENKEKFTDLIEQENLKLGSVKVSFGLQVQFEIERNGKTEEMTHYFKED